MKAVGIILSNIHDKDIPELTSIRSIASVPFGGRYRLIDFALSNMVNSGTQSCRFPFRSGATGPHAVAFREDATGGIGTQGGRSAPRAGVRATVG